MQDAFDVALSSAPLVELIADLSLGQETSPQHLERQQDKSSQNARQRFRTTLETLVTLIVRFLKAVLSRLRCSPKCDTHTK